MENKELESQELSSKLETMNQQYDIRLRKTE